MAMTVVVVESDTWDPRGLIDFEGHAIVSSIDLDFAWVKFPWCAYAIKMHRSMLRELT